MTKPKNILLVRTDRIGDVVLSLPLAKLIKKQYPECKVTFLMRAYTKDLVQNHPNIDNVILLKERDGNIFLSDNLRKIKSYNFDTCIIIYPKFKIALFLLLAGIKNRIGTGYRWYSFLFNNKFYEHRKYGEKHELEYNLNLLKNLGIEEKQELGDVEFNIQVSQKSIHFIEELLAGKKIDRNLPILIIHPGSGGSAVDWPISRLKSLIKLMAHELSVNLIITGSQSEKELCDMLVYNDKIINLAGLLTLAELMALIQKSHLFIANSTGPIHVAAALGKEVIGFYPKIPSCSEARWGPYTEKKKIFSPSIECENCTRKQCEELNCMNSIDERDVFESVKEIVRKVVKSSIQ